MKYIKHLILVLALSIPLAMGGQNLLPPIHIYKIYEYNAASKNWGLTANENGELFVANNKGLLHFNGEEWTLYQLPNKTVIRSVAYIKGKVYTGSYETGNTPNSPLLPFGYGLSYTEFEYSDLRLNKSEIGADEPMTVTVNLKNIGNYDGGEVVQLYLRDVVRSITPRMRQLKGFKKVS